MRSTVIRTLPDPLHSLPVKSFWCQTIGVPRKGCRVNAITQAGAKLEGAHKLRVMPNRVVVVESQTFLPSLELC